jgi:hypothetical protein
MGDRVDLIGRDTRTDDGPCFPEDLRCDTAGAPKTFRRLLVVELQ